jgi:hypothetical protein
MSWRTDTEARQRHGGRRGRAGPHRAHRQ